MKRPPERVVLSDLVRVDATEYLKRFGFSRSIGSNQHTVFAHRTKHRTWVIPALALMRALFRPTNRILEEVFRHQALERLTSPCPTREGGLVYLAHWKRSGTPVELNTTLDWVSRDPNAKQMMDSVHRRALAGCIDMEPASIELMLTMKGLCIGHTIFVTSVKASAVRSTLDPSLVFDIGRNTLKSPSIAGIKNTLRATKRADNEVELTDEEWERVRGYLSPSNRGAPVKTDTRAALNGILYRLTGTIAKWHELSVLGHPYSLYLSGCEKWTRTGALKKVVEELNAMRAQETRLHGTAPGDQLL